MPPPPVELWDTTWSLFTLGGFLPCLSHPESVTWPSSHDSFLTGERKAENRDAPERVTQ